MKPRLSPIVHILCGPAGRMTGRLTVVGIRDMARPSIGGKEEMVQKARLHRLLVAIIVAAALFCLAPTAHGSPPDQTWIGGFYDNADFDDVVLLITSNVVVVERSMGPSLRPQRFVISFLLAECDRRPPSSPSSAFNRGPPTIRDDHRG
jgi:hypothetical protein